MFFLRNIFNKHAFFATPFLLYTLSRLVMVWMMLLPWRRQRLALPWALALLLPSQPLRWSWPMTTSPASWLPLRRVEPFITTWSSLSATSSPPTSERLCGEWQSLSYTFILWNREQADFAPDLFSQSFLVSSWLLLLVFLRLWSQFSFCGWTWWLTVFLPPLWDSTPLIWTSWARLPAPPKSPSSLAGSSSDTWPLEVCCWFLLHPWSILFSPCIQWYCTFPDYLKTALQINLSLRLCWCCNCCCCWLVVHVLWRRPYGLFLPAGKNLMLQGLQ